MMKYSFFITGLRNLYLEGNAAITLDKLTTMLENGIITQEEFDYITS